MADKEGTRQAMMDYGLPSRWAGRSAGVLIALEIALSYTVLLDPTSRGASALLGLLFLLICAALTNLLRQEKAPPCHCFGAIHSEPVSWKTVARAALLIGLSALCLYLPNSSLTPSLWSAICLTCGYILILKGSYSLASRRQKDQKRTRKSLEMGQRVPAVTLPDGRWLESILSSKERTLLLVTSNRCSPCKDLKHSLNGWATHFQDDLNIIELDYQNNDKDQSTKELSFQSIPISYDEFRRFKSPTPGGFLVDKVGTILHPPVVGAEEFQALLRLTLNESERPET